MIKTCYCNKNLGTNPICQTRLRPLPHHRLRRPRARGHAGELRGDEGQLRQEPKPVPGKPPHPLRAVLQELRQVGTKKIVVGESFSAKKCALSRGCRAVKLIYGFARSPAEERNSQQQKECPGVGVCT